MSNRKRFRSYLIGLTLFAMALSLGLVIMPAQASAPTLQGTPMPAGTAIVPNTGSNAAGNNIGLGWLVWILLGIAIIALIVALATRSTSSTDI